MDPVALLEGALKIYGPATQEQPVGEYLVAQMNAAGLRAFRDQVGNAVGILENPLARMAAEEPGMEASSPSPAERGRAGVGASGPAVAPKELVLLGHMDTVPGFIEVRRDGDTLYGRGAVDARGPLCTAISAVARVGVRSGWRLIVVGAVEEEYATSKGARFAATQYHPEYCIIGEPSGWDRVTLGYKGRLLLHYRQARSMSHTAGQVRGVAESAVDFWNRLNVLAAERNRGKTRAFDLLDPSLRRIHTGDDPFVDEVALTIGIRVPVGVDMETLKADIGALGRDAELTFASQEPAYRADKNTPLVRALVAGIRAHGGTAAFNVKTGTSDMNVVAPVWGCPMVAYGPGDSNLDHTPHEHIDLDEYLRAVDVLADALRELTAS